MATVNGTNGDDTLYGTGESDTINGRDGHDVLKGFGGADRLDGGAGIDSAFYGDSTVGVVVNLATGRGFGGSAEGDTLISIEYLYGSEFNDTLTGDDGVNDLYGQGGNDILKGGGGADGLDGGGGDDTLKGGGGADWLDGGAGNDTADYTASEAGVYADLQRPTVVPGPGTEDGDQFFNVENLTGSAYEDTLYGTDGSNVLSGRDGNDNLHGRAGADTLNGGNGEDTLHGDFGVDTMIGGAGNDHYEISDTADVIIENAGEGLDSVTSMVTYTLSANVENLGLSGQGPMNAVGNALANRLLGNESSNVMDGRGGADYMNGNTGDDTYFVDDPSDFVRDLPGFGALDRVFTSVSYTLRAGQEIEQLRTDDQSGAGAIDLTGNEFYNTINGNNGANTLNGGRGDDMLVGHGGADRFLFDTALNAANNVDRIIDFAVNLDRIFLDDDIFLGIGTMAPVRFNIGTAAATVAHRIIYSQASGALFYDPDGTGKLAQVRFATLEPNLALDSADFLMVA